MRIAMYLGGSHTHTVDAGNRIAARLERRLGIQLQRYDLDLAERISLESYEVLIFGCSTWYGGELPSCWARELPQLQKVSLRGKRVALFGVGNQLLSPDTFQDGLGILAEQVELRGGEIIGLWPAEDYTFRSSRALRGDLFAGLALDYANQADFNELRIVLWTEQLVREIARTLASAGGLDQPKHGGERTPGAIPREERRRYYKPEDSDAQPPANSAQQALGTPGNTKLDYSPTSAASHVRLNGTPLTPSHTPFGTASK